MSLPNDTPWRRRVFLWTCCGNLATTLVLWTLYLVTARDCVLSLEPAWLSRLLSEAMRFAAFLLPTLLAVWLNPLDHWRDYRDMFGHLRSGIAWGLAVGCGLIVVNAAAAHLVGKLALPSAEQFRSGTSVAFSSAVLLEELTYRGYIFRNLQAVTSGWVAGFVSAVAFVLIHFPGWILVMHLSWEQIARHSISVFLLGLVLAFVLRKSRSIYAPLLVHGANNFASIVFRI